jgi:hypothetical protein
MAAELLIEHGGHPHHFADPRQFETAYVYLLRTRAAEARGRDGERTLFSIRAGIERTQYRRSILYATPTAWTPPHRALVYGVLSQWPSDAALARHLDLSRNTLVDWKAKANIQYFTWTFLLGLLGIAHTPRLNIDVVDYQHLFRSQEA